MIFLRGDFIFLFLCCSIVTAGAQKWDDVKLMKGKFCEFDKPGPLKDGSLKIVPMDRLFMLQECGDLCVSKGKKCTGFQLMKKICFILKDPVFRTKDPANSSNNMKKLYVCGRKGPKPTYKPTSLPTNEPTKSPVTNDPTSSPPSPPPTKNPTAVPTKLPSAAPVTNEPTKATKWHGKIFTYKKNSQCRTTEDEDENSRTFNGVTSDRCDNICGNKPSCMAYTWIRGTTKCIIYFFRPRSVISNRRGSVCARVAKPTQAPVPPSPPPTKNPTAVPTENPTKELTKKPTVVPTKLPSAAPVTDEPTKSPVTNEPTKATKWHGKIFTYKKNSQCRTTEDDDENSRTFNGVTNGRCDNICGNKPSCMAYTWIRDTTECIIYFFRPRSVISNKQGSICARVAKPTQAPIPPSPPPTKNPTAVPTKLPSAAPVTNEPTKWHGKIFTYKKNSQCRTTEDEDENSRTYNRVTNDRCDNICGNKPSCMAYTWIRDTTECIIYFFRPNTVISNKQGSVCARVAKPTQAPVPPTPSPTSAPTATCEIKATLGYDFTDPDNAPYYGQHNDWLEISKLGGEMICAAYYHKRDDNPPWCKYFNSAGKDGDGAHVDNFEDEYYTDAQLANEVVTRETMTVEKASEAVTVVEVYHWLFPEDWYAEYKEWNDHMMPPHLEIFNLSNPDQDKIGGPYHHVVEKNIPTHIRRGQEWVGNPMYEGNFRLHVVCDSSCICSVENYEGFKGFFS